jgi:hypothetical protein
MPHQRCGACDHDEHEAIDAALESGASMRKVADRFGLAVTTIFLHTHHDDDKKKPVNIGVLKRIDKEIAMLKAAQTKAKRSKNNGLALNLSKEIRNWFTLRVKAVTAEAIAGAQSQESDHEAITAQEALALARSVIESQLDSDEVRSWLRSLLDRIPPIQ